NESLAVHQRGPRWSIWPGPDVPRTPTQKIRKQIVAEKVRASLVKAIPVGTTSDAHPLNKIVARLTKEVAPQFDPTAKLGTDLKLDSLGRVELLSALEDRYQLEIDEGSFTDATTLAEVEGMIREGRHEEVAQYPYPKWQQRWPLSWLRIALLYLIVLPITRVLGWPRIRGREYLRNVRGSLVFIC